MKWTCKLVTLLIAINGLLEVTAAPRKSQTEKDRRTKKGREQSSETQIVGGSSTDKPSWPWQVAILLEQDGKSQFHCGGSMLTPSHVLTAAHCVGSSTVSLYTVKVRAGEQNRAIDEGTEQTVVVANIVVHPNYTGTLNSLYSHDLAVLRLQTPLTVTSHVAPVPRLALTSDPGSPTLCYMTGWGIDNTKGDGGGDLTPVLSEDEVRLLSNQECNKRRYWDGLVKPHQLCAYSKQSAACLGDSGGPLVCKVGNQFVQYGVTSWGSKSCDKKPTVFTRISFYSDWLDSTLALN